MTTTMRVSMLASVALFALSLAAPAQAQSNTMSFFVTSVGSGKSGDLGGPAGAGAHCQALPAAAGAGCGRSHTLLCCRGGLNDKRPSNSGNASPPSRGWGGGGSKAALKSTGGGGIYYCFATTGARWRGGPERYDRGGSPGHLLWMQSFRGRVPAASNKC